MDEILTIDLDSSSLTIKYGAAALMSLKGAVLCSAIIVSSAIQQGILVAEQKRLTPLLVLDLLDWIIPCVACIVDDDVYLTIPKFSGLLDKIVNSVVVGDVSANGNGRTTFSIDGFSGLLSFHCSSISFTSL